MQRTRWVLALCIAGVAAARGAVFQYTVPVTGGKGGSAAFLWVPPRAQQVRGAILAGMALMEREFAKDPRIREACADQQLAIVFLKCGLGGADPQQVLDDLAKVSGYRELSVAPLMFVGHSAGGPQARDCAVKFADRCFGLVQYRGGGPWGTPPVPPSVPCMMMVGQFDEFWGTMRREDGSDSWERMRGDMAAYRALNATNLASMVIEPGAGHFAWSDRNAALLALFIRKAAQARIPAAWPIDAAAPVALNAIDPRSGWLTDLNVRSADAHKPAAYADYGGAVTNAMWHFDRELAEAAVAYEAGIAGKKDQFIKWNDPFWVDAGTRYFFTNLKWVGDGQTFEVHPVYADVYPAQHNGQGPRWLEAGQPVGHSSAPIQLKQVSGPVVPTGPNTFRMQYDSLAPATEGARVTFMAFSVGDAEYRYTEHVGMMPRGFNGLNGGKEQTLTFPPIGNLKADAGPVTLAATSDSGLPVEYYVAYGPAVVENGKLQLTELPARAAYPIEIKVVACQFGSGVAPQVKTAKPVEQTLRVEEPN